jgi:pantothenate kinase type III
MQGLITLDFGNTHPSAGLFQKQQGQWALIKVVPWSELSLYLTQLEMNPDNTQIVLCEVRSREEELLPFLQQGYLLTRLKDYWRGERFAGMPVQYAKTLGEDRLIIAHYLYKKKMTPTLIADAGTFLTLDIISQKGFEGGYILPGPFAYFSCFQNGEQLKQVSLKLDTSSELPLTTAQAMQRGYQTVAALIKELSETHLLKNLVLTGGWSSDLRELLGDFSVGVTVQLEPHLIHWALQHWMTTQIEPL